MVRLQKYIAQCGVASRRKSEDLITEGRIKVNGNVVTELGFKVNLNDKIELDGKLLKLEKKKIYVMLNKPVGYITTTKDQFYRKTVLDLINGIEERIFPVGRLDYDTSGLIILTNDGEFTNKITHPTHEIEKTYVAKVLGVPNKDDIQKLREGVLIDDYLTASARVNIKSVNNGNAVVKISIHEGKNRQVRRMFEAIGYNVLNLRRTAIGPLRIGELAEGEWRYLSRQEVKILTLK